MLRRCQQCDGLAILYRNDIAVRVASIQDGLAIPGFALIVHPATSIVDRLVIIVPGQIADTAPCTDFLQTRCYPVIAANVQRTIVAEADSLRASTDILRVSMVGILQIDYL